MSKVFPTKTKTYEVELYQTSDGSWIAGYEFALAHEERLETQKKMEIRKKIQNGVQKKIIELEVYELAEELYNFKTQEEADIFNAPGVDRWAKLYDSFVDEYGDSEYRYIQLGEYIGIIEKYLEEIKDFYMSV